jgi:hypothetical protein
LGWRWAYAHQRPSVESLREAALKHLGAFPRDFGQVDDIQKELVSKTPGVWV